MRSTTTTTSSALATFALLLSSAPTALSQTTSSKRGLVYVNPTSPSDLQFWTSGDLTWYYNYVSTPTAALTSSSLHFVPMLWGATAATSTTDLSFYNAVKSQIQSGSNITHVLGFNEPDGCFNGGSCVDAQTAAEAWVAQMEPLKAQFGVKLGAPAVTSAPTGFNWLQNFFTQCAGRCHPDFIPVHWYGNFEGLASHVGQVNATYPNMTMWVTEYALAGGSLADNQEFYNESAAFLDRVPYIDRYSYFGAFRSSVSNVGVNAAFLTGKGQLTDIGAWYLGDAATGNIPTASAAGWSVLGGQQQQMAAVAVAAAVVVAVVGGMV